MATTETTTETTDVEAPEAAVAATPVRSDDGRTRTQATAKFVRVSARKARLIADLIRGESVPNAQAILAFATRDAAVPVRKVLESAMANADHNAGMNVRDLFVTRATVDEGPTMKRFQPRAMGRAGKINKRTCHITIGLGPAEDA